MIKSLYLLSTFALINFVATITIVNIQGISNKQVENINSPTPTPIMVIRKVIKRVIEQPTQSSAQVDPTITPSQSKLPKSVAPKQPNATTAPPAQKGCVVTIDGNKYDLTNFINQHSGGNIFNCGTDMSNTFWNKHSQSELNKIQKYRV